MGKWKICHVIGAYEQEGQGNVVYETTKILQTYDFYISIAWGKLSRAAPDGVNRMF